MNYPVVVQGTAVQQVTELPVPAGGPTEVSERPASKTGCQDPIFAVLFYINIAAIVAVAAMYGGDILTGGFTYSSYAAPIVMVGVISIGASLVGLFLLMACPELMIKAGLIFSLLVAFIFMVYSFMFQSILSGVLFAFFFLITICYVRLAWRRIPFAAINMLTAATAIKKNLGVSVFALLFTILEVVWIGLWTVALSGVVVNGGNCDENGVCMPNYGILFLLFLSLFFAQQVFQNCVHVTVAGTVATWWIAPSESGFCSKGVCNSFIRTVTTSFGSICFGSLLVAILQALQQLANTARSNDNCAILACVFECILSCLASIMEYFNKWAFIYVGVYGFSYIESGKNVMQLFANRGWEAIIADDLVSGAVTLLAILFALIIGGIAFASKDLPIFEALVAEFGEENSGIVAFFVGFLPSLMICSILLSLISSGVNTVIVMFADAPQEFQQNHPELSTKMREKWAEFYPDSI
mmetsp:Transcript_4832/g.12426  ORF Transcript_4832/g.12426 Transcript_4832/m.12426 type:complete len:468 (+) Transcript_4832:198-1601(+)